MPEPHVAEQMLESDQSVKPPSAERNDYDLFNDCIFTGSSGG